MTIEYQNSFSSLFDQGKTVADRLSLPSAHRHSPRELEPSGPNYPAACAHFQSVALQHKPHLSLQHNHLDNRTRPNNHNNRQPQPSGSPQQLHIRLMLQRPSSQREQPKSYQYGFIRDLLCTGCNRRNRQPKPPHGYPHRRRWLHNI